MAQQVIGSPVGMCRCGCGGATAISPRNRISKGHIKGKPYRFIPGHQRRLLTPEYRAEERGYTTPCWTWMRYVDEEGYGRKYHKGRAALAHRVYYEKVNGEIPKGITLDHLCRNRDCVNPEHCEPVTNLENLRRGRATKLTEAEVREIKSLLGSASQKYLALRYGVSKHAIEKISQGTAWADVSGERNAIHPC